MILIADICKKFALRWRLSSATFSKKVCLSNCAGNRSFKPYDLIYITRLVFFIYLKRIMLFIAHLS